MAKLCALFIFFAIFNVKIHAALVRDKRDIESNSKFDSQDPLRRGWQKQPTCGRPGKPCPSSSTLPPSTPTIEIATANPPTTVTMKEPPTGSSIRPESTTAMPQPVPTLETTSTLTTPVETEIFSDDSHRPSTTPSRPETTTRHTGAIVFPDDDDFGSETTYSLPVNPISRPTVAPTPNVPIDKEKEPEVITNNPYTTPSAEVAACMLNCPVTPEYNPVCGSNGITYTSPGRLICAQECGARVSEVHRGFCHARFPVTTESPVIRSCINNCPVIPGFYPICGTNGITYNNAGHLLCAQSCGVNVRLFSHNPCSTTATSSPTSATYPVIDGGSDNEVTTNNPTSSSTSPSTALRGCMLGCSATRELDPVCGTDGNTYVNPAYVRCAQVCGVEVEIVTHGRCPDSTTVSVPSVATRSPIDATTPSIVVRNCMQRCPSTNEYNPVCGSNFVTYDNPGKLHCARVCGMGVTELRHGPCIPGRRNRNKTTTTTPRTNKP